MTARIVRHAALLLCLALPAAAGATTVTAPSTPLDLGRNLTGAPPGSLAGNGIELISASLTLADGSGAPPADAYALFSGAPAALGFTSGVALTTGHRNSILTASDPGSTSSVWSDQNGTSSPPPADWFTANGNAFPKPPGRPEPKGLLAHDPTMLTLTFRTTGSKVDLRWIFASEEFEVLASPDPSTAANDLGIVLADSAYSGTPANPADKNCAYVAGDNGERYPATTYVLHDSGLVRSDPSRALTSLWGLTDAHTCSFFVVPGETVTLRMVVFELNDGYFDSALLLGAGSLNADTPPVAALAAEPASGSAPLAATLSTAGSTDDEGIVNWSLTFGDGQSTSGAGAPPASVAHSYAGAGSYTATLTVADAISQENATTASVTVTAPGAQAGPPGGGAQTPATPSPVTPVTPAAPSPPTFSLPASINLKTALKGVPVTVRCATVCDVSAQLRLDAKDAKKATLKGILGTAKAGLEAGVPRLVRPRLSATAGRKLRKTKLKKATLLVRLAVGAVQAERKVTLKLR